MNDLFELIRASVPAKEVARRYGLEPNRAGFARCPFHGGDNTPSLKLYDGARGWHCFGCGAGGDVVDLVGRLFHLGPKEAAERINADFCLGLVMERPRKGARPPPAVLEQRARQAQRADMKNRLIANCREHASIWIFVANHRPVDDDDARKVADLLARLDRLEYEIEGGEDDLRGISERV